MNPVVGGVGGGGEKGGRGMRQRTFLHFFLRVV